MFSITFFLLSAVGIPAAAIVSLVALARRKTLTAQIAGITAVKCRNSINLIAIW